MLLRSCVRAFLISPISCRLYQNSISGEEGTLYDTGMVRKLYKTWKAMGLERDDLELALDGKNERDERRQVRRQALGLN
jgi:hypothetical protein